MTSDKRLVECLILIFLTLLWLPVSAGATTITIADFGDPAENSSLPLFMVDLTAGDNGYISGGWIGLHLDLEVLSSTTYENAIVTMTDVEMTAVTDPFRGIKTKAGTIEFFEFDHVTKLFQIEFDSAWVSLFGVGATGQDIILVSDNVTISGPALGNYILSDESFAFSFANHQPIQGDWTNGFSATASFTSSAIVIPEPITVLLLGLGSLMLRKRRM